MPTALSVNLNKVALLRNSRPLDVPSVERAGRLALDAGAHGLTVHPRPDGRHIRPPDVPAIARLLAEVAPGREFNIEGNPFMDEEAESAAPDYPGFTALVRQAIEAGGVAQATLVPDTPGQNTSDHGWNLDRDGERLGLEIARLQKLGCRVSLFLDPNPEAMAMAAALGADRVELYTEPYARAFDRGDAQAALARYAEAARAAHEAGLGVNAGHDLTLDNLDPFLRAVPHVEEVSIGHALTADALWMGYEAAVRAYLDVIQRAGV